MLSAESQPANNLSFGEFFDLNVHSDAEMNELALQAFPDDTYCMIESNPISPIPWDSTSFDSSSTPISDFDVSSNSGISTPPGSEISSQVSSHIGKNQISVLQPAKCTHCSERFSSEQRLGKHIQKYHKHLESPIICSDCGSSYTSVKDLKRHQRSVQCRTDVGLPPPRRLYVCKCGSDYTRNDHLLRHINLRIKRGGENERRRHHAVPVGQSN